MASVGDTGSPPRRGRPSSSPAGSGWSCASVTSPVLVERDLADTVAAEGWRVRAGDLHGRPGCKTSSSLEGSPAQHIRAHRAVPRRRRPLPYRSLRRPRHRQGVGADCLARRRCTASTPAAVIAATARTPTTATKVAVRWELSVGVVPSAVATPGSGDRQGRHWVQGFPATLGGRFVPADDGAVVVVLCCRELQSVDRRGTGPAEIVNSADPSGPIPVPGRAVQVTEVTASVIWTPPTVTGAGRGVVTVITAATVNSVFLWVDPSRHRPRARKLRLQLIIRQSATHTAAARMGLLPVPGEARAVEFLLADQVDAGLAVTARPLSAANPQDQPPTQPMASPGVDEQTATTHPPAPAGAHRPAHRPGRVRSGEPAGHPATRNAAEGHLSRRESAPAARNRPAHPPASPTCWSAASPLPTAPRRPRRAQPPNKGQAHSCTATPRTVASDPAGQVVAAIELVIAAGPIFR